MLPCLQFTLKTFSIKYFNCTPVEINGITEFSDYSKYLLMLFLYSMSLSLGPHNFTNDSNK
jgi:hypothetical protein